MFIAGQLVKDESGLVGIIKDIDPIDEQGPDTWALIVAEHPTKPEDTMWTQLKYLTKAN